MAGGTHWTPSDADCMFGNPAGKAHQPAANCDSNHAGYFMMMRNNGATPTNIRGGAHIPAGAVMCAQEGKQMLQTALMQAFVNSCGPSLGQQQQQLDSRSTHPVAPEYDAAAPTSIDK